MLKKGLADLQDLEIKKITARIDAPIMGLALKSLPVHTQKRVLSLCQRTYAEKAYLIMNTPISDEEAKVEKACERIKALVAKSIKKNG